MWADLIKYMTEKLPTLFEKKEIDEQKLVQLLKEKGKGNIYDFIFEQIRNFVL